MIKHTWSIFRSLLNAIEASSVLLEVTRSVCLTYFEWKTESWDELKWVKHENHSSILNDPSRFASNQNSVIRSFIRGFPISTVKWEPTLEINAPCRYQTIYHPELIENLFSKNFTSSDVYTISYFTIFLWKNRWSVLLKRDMDFRKIINKSFAYIGLLDNPIDDLTE